MNITDKIKMHNRDCMELMADFPDNHFDLAIVDPPYGIAENSYRKDQHKNNAAIKRDYHMAVFNQSKPGTEYFDELSRVCRNYIVWGGNYFADILPWSRHWIAWDKDCESSQFADIELAYTSFKNSSRIFRHRWNGMLQHNMQDKEDRIHPTQKPVRLYRWILDNYAKEGDKILDTHGGSGSICIACHDRGFDLTWTELDDQYYEAAVKRVNAHVSQLKLAI